MPMGFEPRISWLYQLSHNLWLIFFRSFIAIIQPSLSHVLWKLKIHVWKCTLTFYCQVVSRFHSKDCTKSNFREVRYFGLKEKASIPLYLIYFGEKTSDKFQIKVLQQPARKLREKAFLDFGRLLKD